MKDQEALSKNIRNIRMRLEEHERLLACRRVKGQGGLRSLPLLGLPPFLMRRGILV